MLFNWLRNKEISARKEKLKSSSQIGPLVFLHIPKTAGTRVREIIDANLGIDNALHIYSPYQIAYLTDDEINHYTVIAGHTGHAIMRRVNNASFTFTFLRDPLEVVLSLYAFWRRVETIPGDPGPEYAKKLSLEDFLTCDHPSIQAHISNMQTWFMYLDFGVVTRHDNAHVPEGEILAHARTNLEALDFVGIQADFAACMEKIQRLRGWPVAEDRRSNTSDSSRYLEGLSSRARELIEERNQLDRQLYQHAAALSKQHLQP